ncbi:GntR family transcriptional regulator [Streptomyces hirsutus]
MTTHGVARMTARQALSVLRAEGVAEARKGAGVFVRPSAQSDAEASSDSPATSGAPAAPSGRRTRTGHLRSTGSPCAEETAPDRINAVLNLTGDGTTLRRRRFVLDGKPVLLATNYLPMPLVAGSAITQEDTGPGGTYARLAELGYEPVHFREEIRSTHALAGRGCTAEHVRSTPVILICRTAFTDTGHPVEVNEMTLDAASYVLGRLHAEPENHPDQRLSYNLLHRFQRPARGAGWPLGSQRSNGPMVEPV